MAYIENMQCFRGQKTDNLDGKCEPSCWNRKERKEVVCGFSNLFLVFGGGAHFSKEED